MSDYKLAEIIGEGNFRVCYAVTGRPDICVKRIKPGLRFLRRMHLFLFRSGMNREEYKTYQRLPEALKPYFNPVIDAGKNYLVTGRPMDFDGSHSRPVCAYGKISNDAFWKKMEKIISLFEHHNIWFFDAFQKGNNVFVQRISEHEWQPIIVDYKRIGWKSYPVQVNLLVDSEKKKKFYRKYTRFINHFRALK